jgi:hypothetical protein
MTPRVSLEGVASAGAYYRVARHFPIDRRRRLVALIEDVAFPSGSVQQRFDGFVRSVRTFANQAAEEFGSDRRRVRPLSGASKFLWYRCPLHGFIYDSQVLAAVCKNGLTVRFDTLVDGFGGRPSDQREWNFMIAAAAYRAFALPLHRTLWQAAGRGDAPPSFAVGHFAGYTNQQNHDFGWEFESLQARHRPVGAVYRMPTVARRSNDLLESLDAREMTGHEKGSPETRMRREPCAFLDATASSR